MEQTRNKGDAMRKKHEIKHRKRDCSKKSFFEKKRRNFCIWFDIKEKIRKRRKMKKRGMRSRTKERRKMSQSKRRYTKRRWKKRQGNMRLKKKEEEKH